MAILVCSLETCMVSLHGTCLYCTWMSAGDFVAWGITFLNLSHSAMQEPKHAEMYTSSMGCHTVIPNYVLYNLPNGLFFIRHFCLYSGHVWIICIADVELLSADATLYLQRIYSICFYIQIFTLTFFCLFLTLMVDFVVIWCDKMRVIR